MSTIEADPNLDFTNPEVSPFDFSVTTPEDPVIPYIAHKKIAAWPFDEEKVDVDHYSQVGDGHPGWRTTLLSGGQGCTWESLSRTLVIRSPSDAYYSQYIWDVELVGTPRIAKAALERADGSPIFSRINIGIFAVDADCARAHKANGGAGSGVADDAWRAKEREKITAVRQEVPGTFAYESRGGNRLLWTLPRPFRVRSVNDAKRWKVYYVRCLAYLAREYGIICDPATQSWNNLFRAPHATRDKGGKPEELPTYGDPHAVGHWSYLPGPATFQADFDTVARLAANDKTWKERGLSVLTRGKERSRSTAALRSTRSKSAVVVPPANLTLLEAALASAIAVVDDGRHALYLAIAGTLLRRGMAPDEIASICERIALAAGDAKAAKRKDDAASTVVRYQQGADVTGMATLRRSWPQVAAIIDNHLPIPEADGVENLREELASRAPIAAVPLVDVPPKIGDAIDASIEGRHKVTLVRVTPGAGKTAAAAAKASTSTSKTALVFGMNELAKGNFDQIQQVRPDVQRRFGIASALGGNGKPVCLQAESVGAVQTAGLSGAALVCATCPHRGSCSIEGGMEGATTGAQLMLTNHELLSQAANFVGKSGLLVVDETPRVFDHVVLTRSALDSLRKLLSTATYESSFVAASRPLLMWLEELFSVRELLSEQPFADCARTATSQTRIRADWSIVVGSAVVALKLVNTDVKGLDPLALFSQAMEQHSSPPLQPEVLSQIRRGNRKTAEKVQASWPLLSALHCGLCTSRGRVEWDPPQAGVGTSTVLRITLPNINFANVLATGSPVVVLDATGDQQVLEYLSTEPVNTVDIAVEDGAPIERAVRHWANGSRKRAIPGGKVSVDVVAPVVKEALERAAKSGARSILLVSYKPVVDALRAARDQADGHDEKLAASLSTASLHVVLAHYGAIRGKNVVEGTTWDDLDAVITLGDPWPDVAQARAEAELMKLDDVAAASRAHSLAAIELVQVFGRLRAPRRTRPGLLLHYGRVLPSDWHSGNASVEVRPEGRPPLLSSMALADLKTLVQAFGSIRGLAKASGVPETTIRHADSGQRPIGPEMAAKLRPLLAAPSVLQTRGDGGSSSPPADDRPDDAVGDGHRLDTGSLCA